METENNFRLSFKETLNHWKVSVITISIAGLLSSTYGLLFGAVSEIPVSDFFLGIIQGIEVSIIMLLFLIPGIFISYYLFKYLKNKKLRILSSFIIYTVFGWIWSFFVFLIFNLPNGNLQEFAWFKGIEYPLLGLHLIITFSNYVYMYRKSLNGSLTTIR